MTLPASKLLCMGQGMVSRSFLQYRLVHALGLLSVKAIFISPSTVVVTGDGGRRGALDQRAGFAVYNRKHATVGTSHAVAAVTASVLAYEAVKARCSQHVGCMPLELQHNSML